jgi:hypothetical protein
MSANSRAALDPERSLTIVSGLPRSGTSLMMQMLEAAGLSIATDGLRRANVDNPRGFYELDAVKGMRRDASFVKGLVGRAVKIVAPLLPCLPPEFDYRIVFVERDIRETLASQRAMLDRPGGAGSDGRAGSGSKEPAPDADLARAYEHAIREVKRWLVSRTGIETCFVAYRDVLLDPEAQSDRLLAFLEETGGVPATAGGPEARSIIRARMAAVVDPALHRIRMPDSV